MYILLFKVSKEPHVATLKVTPLVSIEILIFEDLFDKDGKSPNVL